MISNQSIIKIILSNDSIKFYQSRDHTFQKSKNILQVII